MQADIFIHDQVLDAYAKGMGEKKWALVGGRLDEGESRSFPNRVRLSWMRRVDDRETDHVDWFMIVRLRGRKRDMIG